MRSGFWGAIAERGWYLEQTFVRRGAVVARAVVQARFLRRSGGTVPMTDLLDAVGGAPADRELPEWVHGWAGAVRISSTGLAVPAMLDHG